MNDNKKVDKIEEFDVFDISKCNHDINSKENSLQVMRLRRMVVPNTLMCHCKNCKKAFKFVKGNNSEGYVIADKD